MIGELVLPRTGISSEILRSVIENGLPLPFYCVNRADYCYRRRNVGQNKIISTLPNFQCTLPVDRSSSDDVVVVVGGDGVV